MQLIGFLSSVLATVFVVAAALSTDRMDVVHATAVAGMLQGMCGTFFALAALRKDK